MVVKEAIMSAPRECPAELRERAVRRVIKDRGHGAMARVADRLGINPDPKAEGHLLDRLDAGRAAA